MANSAMSVDGRVQGKLENLTLWERVYQHLREEILANRLQPGAVLGEVALAESLGVSRGPVREALETLAVRLAVPRLADEEIERLQALVEEQGRRAELGDVEAFFQANAAFHELIVAASGNRTLEEMHRQLVGHMGRYRMRSVALRGTLKRSVGEHRAILRAIKARDAEKAAQLLGEHIHVPQRLLSAPEEEVVLTP